MGLRSTAWLMLAVLQVRIKNPFFPKDRMETDMKVIDFRFRPNTPEIINGIKNSTMFKAACEVIGFDQRKPQPLDEIVADLDAMGVELGVITGRDAETTYGFPANNNSVLEFCRAYPQQVRGPLGHRSPQEDGRRARDREGRQGIRHEGYRHRSLSGPHARQ